MYWQESIEYTKMKLTPLEEQLSICLHAVSLSLPLCLCLSLTPLYGTGCTLASFSISFLASRFITIFLQPLTPILFKSFSASSIFFLAIHRTFFRSVVILKHFLRSFSSDFLSTCLNHRNLPLVISELISGARYRSFSS